MVIYILGPLEFAGPLQVCYVSLNHLVQPALPYSSGKKSRIVRAMFRALLGESRKIEPVVMTRGVAKYGSLQIVSNFAFSEKINELR